MTIDASAQDLTAAASDLRMAVFRLARRMRAQRAVETMSDGQFAVLANLRVHGPHTLTRLAERENVAAPSMTRTVNALEESGWIARTADEGDRRKANIDLTAAGLAIVDETVRRRTAWLEEALADLNEHERAQLAAAAPILTRMAAR